MNVPQNLYGLIARFATIRRKQRFISAKQKCCPKEQQSNIIGRHRRLRTLRGEDVGLFASTSCRSPCMDFLPPSGGVFRLSLAGSSPCIPCRRSCGFQGATGKTETKKPSQNRPALPSLFLEGHASRLCKRLKAKMFSPAGPERICKNMLYSIVGIDYHKNRAVSTKSFENTSLSAVCKKKQ